MRRTAWAFALLCCLFVVLLLAAPAVWLTARLSAASGGRLQAYETRGPWWAGSTRLALSDPGNPRVAPMLLPGHVAWRIAGVSLSPLALRVQVGAPALAQHTLDVQLSPAVSGVKLVMQPWQAKLPLGLLEGFGAPWNTLGLTGTLLWQHDELVLESSTSATNLKGRGTLQILGVESSVSPVRPLGTYRVNWTGDERGLQFTLQTDSGPLLMDGEGQIAGGRFSFSGTAKAAAGHEEALASLLSVIGRREGDVMRLRVSQ